MKLLVTAGGFCKRLEQVLIAVAKALTTVVSVPLLYLQIESEKNHGITSFSFLLHHLANLSSGFIQEENKSGVLKDCEVQSVVESSPVDNGGSVSNAVNQLSLTGNFLVTKPILSTARVTPLWRRQMHRLRPWWNYLTPAGMVA